jgi:hypothetical protein
MNHVLTRFKSRNTEMPIEVREATSIERAKQRLIYRTLTAYVNNIQQTFENK